MFNRGHGNIDGHGILCMAAIQEMNIDWKSWNEEYACKGFINKKAWNHRIYTYDVLLKNVWLSFKWDY